MAFFLVIIVILSAGLVIWAGTQVASPSRRPLMDYHQEFLHHPDKHGFQITHFTGSDGTPCYIVTPDPSGRLGERGKIIREQLASRGLTLSAAGQVHGTLVLLHGRKGRKEDYLPIAERLCAVGFRCIIPDMPAHGDHPETIATYGIREASLPARMLAEASEQFGFAKQPARLLGMSMGGSIAVHAAALADTPWEALVVISTFDSFPSVIEGQASHYAGNTLGPLWAVATNFVYESKSGIALTDILPNKKATDIHIPTLIAHGTADHVVPIPSGKNLFASLPASTRKKWVEIPGADHDNVLVTDFPIYAEIAAWLLLN